ncbi:MAG: hypothetical protein U0270_41860 [Labilithrix sp.]
MTTLSSRTARLVYQTTTSRGCSTRQLRTIESCDSQSLMPSPRSSSSPAGPMTTTDSRVQATQAWNEAPKSVSSIRVSRTTTRAPVALIPASSAV